LALSLLGVILLFIYGMPSRLRTGGKQVRVINETPDSIKAEEHYVFWGRVGLALIGVGTVAQIVAAFLPPPAP